MKITRNRIALAVAAALLALAPVLAGCGTNHDAPNPDVDIVLTWWRLETPPGVVTTYFACFGTTGNYLDQADGNLSQIPDDPMCPKNGMPYQIVQRQGTAPAVHLGTYTAPPDSTGQYQAGNNKP